MQFHHFALTVLSLAAFVCLSTAIDYSTHQVFGVLPTNAAGLKALYTLESDESFLLDFWNHPVTAYTTVYIHVRPQQLNHVRLFLQKHNLPYFVRHSNLQRAIDDFMRDNVPKVRPVAKAGEDFALNTYHTLDEINAFYADLVAEFPNEISVEDIGATLEGRQQRILKIGTGNKPIIFIEAGIHAREWIAPAVTLYFIKNLVYNTIQDPDIDDIRSAYNWHFLTNTNPDGYSYTFTDDRLWRKNRNPNGAAACYGVDINRNFGAGFGLPGASDIACSEAYHGDSAFSELESQHLRDYINGIADNVALYIGFHSYSQLWMYPYGYTDALPSNAARLDELAKAAVDALKAVHGTEYVYGPCYTTIYPASGITIDWIYDGAGIDIVFTPELRDTGTFGFLLPANQIIPTSEETWAATKAIIDRL